MTRAAGERAAPGGGAETAAGGRRGLMLVLSSPSGAGKSTLSRALLAQDPELRLSISVTTRARRPSEADGVHYHFITRRRFEAMRDAGELLEWAEVHGNLYGTPAEAVERHVAAGADVLFDIDWQGTEKLVEKRPADTITVFILPPSAAELRQRLERRAEDAPEAIQRRLAAAKVELGHWQAYDYVIVNDDLDQALRGVAAILAAERLRRSRAPGMPAFVERLKAGL